jgi:uncharacterized protein YndB with AHSA1/START domain
MSHEFETNQEIQVDATPEQVWAAIATGPGVDSWFMGRNQVEPGEGGTVRMSVGDLFTGESTITVWEPPHRLKYQSAAGEDGAFMAFDFLVEGRGQGSTTIRLVHSGVLGGDDWADEYDALRKGDPLYLRTLGLYLTYFAGRIGTPVSAWAAPQPDEATAWAGVTRALGLSGEVAEGDAVRFTLDGSGEIEGVVDTVLYPSFLGVRTGEALYRFVGGGGMIGVGHHIFTNVDEKEAEQTWHTWLARVFA